MFVSYENKNVLYSCQNLVFIFRLVKNKIEYKFSLLRHIISADTSNNCCRYSSSRYVLVKQNLTSLFEGNGPIFHLHHSSIDDLVTFLVKLRSSVYTYQMICHTHCIELKKSDEFDLGSFVNLAPDLYLTFCLSFSDTKCQLFKT